MRNLLLVLSIATLAFSFPLPVFSGHKFVVLDYKDIGPNMEINARHAKQKENSFHLPTSMSTIDLPPGAKLNRDRFHGTVRRLKVDDPMLKRDNDSKFQSKNSNISPVDIAITFIDAYSELFRIKDPVEELTPSRVYTDDLGLTHIRLKQQYNDIPVFQGTINVHLNRMHRVYLVQGHYVPTPDHMQLAPRLNEADAVQAVLNDLDVDKGACRKCRTSLIIYFSRTKESSLGYHVYAETSPDKAWNYVIDAITGNILEKTSAIPLHSD